MTERLHIWSADRLLLCVPADLPAGDVDALRARFHDGPTVDGVLEVLTAGGLAATPSFACASVEPTGVRVVIRGELHAVAHGADGSALTLGAGRAATWNDDVVTDIVRISVDHGGGCFEWIPGTAHPAPDLDADPSHPRAELDADPAHAAPAPPTPPPVERLAAPEPPAVPESHTLDEREFERVVGAATPAETEEPEAPAGLDFSGLLDDTSHGAAPPARPSPPPPSPSPAAPPSEDVPPAEPTPADPTLPSGVAPPPPASRPPISAVPAGGAPVPAPPRPPEPPAGPGTGLGEHDGRTVTLADLRRMQEQAAASGSAAPPDPTGDTPSRSGEVRAVRCPAGHANPPTATTCRICAAAIADTGVVTVPRPVVARLVFDSGLVVDVDRPQLIGRRPSAPPEADEIPNLVTVPSPDSDISRAHTAIRVEGWDVLVEDVGSTNGTEVRLPSREPVRLREHDPVLVVPGTEVTMAGTVRFVVDRPER